MSDAKVSKIIFQRICWELFEVIDMLAEDERNKISKDLIENIKSNMDEGYHFKIDKISLCLKMI